MKRIIFISIFVMMIFSFVGCATWKAVPEITKASNPYFNASLSTLDFWTLILKVQNKTDKNIEIVWNKTYFIDPTGGTHGGGHVWR